MIKDDPEIARIAASLRSSILRMNNRWINLVDHTWVETTQNVLGRKVRLRHKNIDWADTRMTYHLFGDDWHLYASAPRLAIPDFTEFFGCHKTFLGDATLFRLAADD